MESLGYVITNKFLIIAWDSNIQLYLDGILKHEYNNAKKVRVLKNNLAISIVGNHKREAQIYEYISKLNSLGHNQSFDDTLKDLKSVFGIDKMSKEILKNEIEYFNSLLNSGKLNSVEEQLKYINENEITKNFREDGINNFFKGMNIPSVYLFGVDNNPLKMRIAKIEVQGYSSFDNELTQIPKDGIFMSLDCATVNKNFIKEIEEFEMNNIMPFLIEKWEDDEQATEKLIIATKQALKNSLEKISPHTGMVPNIIFCELSKNTNYEFRLPDIFLTEYNFK